ncbi:hypothetical protein A7U60_g7069 [Sanghuangporus baumii]|uniref:J domain-containing protein n=1 Tax=Sanghuangporus baumii TaxID=108892 RepID=A0A9Q5N0W5_SANBA|nr:hypothetical protein A7U60_g7069 [Sanghuangporus baumii]
MMGQRQVGIEEAYAVLGLENGASSEEVKSAYKKLAMKTHPDKNPDASDATQKFQEVGAAYNILIRHFDKLETTSAYQSDFWQSDYSDVDSDYFEDEYNSDDEPDLDFYMFVFDDFLRGNFHGVPRFAFYPNGARQTWQETDERNEQLRNKREEREAARKLRAMEDQRRKERLREQKERDRAEAEERQKQRILNKRARAEAAKQEAARKALLQRQQMQQKRSAVFAAARCGDAEAVKKGIWEDSVDAAGGEIRPGCEEFVPRPPQDTSETLLHLAAANRNVELVEWLVNHNAEPDERNSNGFTAFHLALQKGYIPIVQYFFRSLPPTDADHQSIYTAPPSTDLLQLAMNAFEPELVWMVLANMFASKQQISEAWTSLCSKDAQSASGRSEMKDYLRHEEEIKNLLMSYGGLTPPSTPKKNLSEFPEDEKKTANPRPKKPVINSKVPAAIQQTPTPISSPVPSIRSQSSPISRNGTAGNFNGRGQNQPRGRGRGRARGHGRGRG